VEDAVQAFRLVDENGRTAAGPADITNNDLRVRWTDRFTVPVGRHVYKVVATLTTNGGWATGDTITVSINTPARAIVAESQARAQVLTATPDVRVSATTQTVRVGGLSVTRNSTPTDKTVIAGSLNNLMGSWSFDATGSGEDIRVTTIAFRASTYGKFNALTLKVNGVTQSPINDNPASSFNPNATSTFALVSPFVIAKGTVVNVELYGNLGSNALAGEVDAWGLTDTNATANTSVVAYGVTTGNRAVVNLVANNGARLSVAGSGTLTVNLDGSNPASRLIVFGTTGVSLAELRLKATNETIDLTGLKIRVEDGGLVGSTNRGDYTQVQKVFLKLDGAVVGSAFGYSLGGSDTTVNFQRGEFTIPVGSTGKKLSLLGDIVYWGTNLPGRPNADIKVGIAASSVVAVGTGSNSTAAVVQNESMGSPVTLRRSVPTVVIEQPSNRLSTNAVLHRVKISAVGSDIGLYRLAYMTQGSVGISVNSVYTKLVSCGGCGGIADGSQLSRSQTSSIDAGDRQKIWDLPIDSSQSHGKAFLNIAAGATAVIDLYGNMTLTSGSDIVSTRVLGDGPFTANLGDVEGNPVTAFTAGSSGGSSQGNFVWSDMHDNDSNTATALNAYQWYNGYYVSGLGTTTNTTPVSVAE